jgi:hypothetical protein
MLRLRRFHFADVAGIVLAILLIVVGFFALVSPHDMIIFHPTGDITGGPAGTIIEKMSPARVRFYGGTAVILGVGLGTFLFWALRGDDKPTI